MGFVSLKKISWRPWSQQSAPPWKTFIKSLFGGVAASPRSAVTSRRWLTHWRL